MVKAVGIQLLPSKSITYLKLGGSQGLGYRTVLGRGLAGVLSANLDASATVKMGSRSVRLVCLVLNYKHQKKIINSFSGQLQGELPMGGGGAQKSLSNNSKRLGFLYKRMAKFEAEISGSKYCKSRYGTIGWL